MIRVNMCTRWDYNCGNWKFLETGGPNCSVNSTSQQNQACCLLHLLAVSWLIGQLLRIVQLASVEFKLLQTETCTSDSFATYGAALYKCVLIDWEMNTVIINMHVQHSIDRLGHRESRKYYLLHFIRLFHLEDSLNYRWLKDWFFVLIVSH